MGSVRALKCYLLIVYHTNGVCEFSQLFGAMSSLARVLSTDFPELIHVKS